MKVGIIDYGVGNLKSLSNALDHLMVPSIVSNNIQKLHSCSHLILPGVGAFGAAMELLRTLELDRFVQDAAKRGQPILGICLGMQMLMESSSEFGDHQGLGLIRGKVQRLSALGEKNVNDLLLPNVNWLSISVRAEIDSWIRSIEGEEMYFIHSYGVSADISSCLGFTRYEHVKIAAIVGIDNVVGVQFHPEKSRRAGLSFLKSFIEWR